LREMALLTSITDPQPPDRLDEATSQRLARLRSLPVDTTRLEAAVRQQIEPATDRGATRARRRWRLWRIAAAIVVVAALAGSVLLWASRPTTPAAADPAEIHRQMVSNSCAPMRVDSIEAAQEALTTHWSGAPDLPHPSGCQTMSCCTHRIGWHRLACVCLKCGTDGITMAVGDASKLRLPKSETISRNGISYCVQSSGGVNIITAHHEGRWICLMGSVSVEQLLSIAADMRP